MFTETKYTMQELRDMAYQMPYRKLRMVTVEDARTGAELEFAVIVRLHYNTLRCEVQHMFTPIGGGTPSSPDYIEVDRRAFAGLVEAVEESEWP